MATATQIIEPEIKRLLAQGRSPYQIEKLLADRYGHRVITARGIYHMKSRFAQQSQKSEQNAA